MTERAAISSYHICRKFLLGCLMLLCVRGFAQDGQLKDPGVDGHLVWVMPFQNDSAQPGLDWIGASFPDILNERLSSAGFLTIRREDRQYALQHLGLPADFHPTQATTYRIAQTLDADYVVFGNYTVANGRITATARVLWMSGPRMSAALEERGNLDQLINIENELAWKLATQIDPTLKLEEQTFVAAGHDLRLDAFENYIRGEVEPGAAERLSHLTKAVEISPAYTQAWLALGKAYFADQRYEEATTPFSKVPKGSRMWLEATFYAGLSHLYTGNYVKAQSEFASIAAVLPMPEVLNNEGIAENRRGQNGTALFQRVVQLDPQSADYWFNLAVSERRAKNYSAALSAVERSLTLRTQDKEAEQLKANITMLKEGRLPVVHPEPIKNNVNPAGNAQASGEPVASSTILSPKPAETAATQDNAEYEPLERIARAYNESSFRQTAFEMEEMSAMKLRSMPPADRAKLLCQQGAQYVNEGLLLEAERKFQLAVASDPANANAYAGLAQVHEYAGSTKIAEQEAAKSLQVRPNAAAYLVLARIELGERSFSSARKDAEQALQIDPNNSAAKGILQSIQMQQSKP